MAAAHHLQMSDLNARVQVSFVFDECPKVGERGLELVDVQPYMRMHAPKPSQRHRRLGMDPEKLVQGWQGDFHEGRMRVDRLDERVVYWRGSAASEFEGHQGGRAVEDGVC